MSHEGNDELKEQEYEDDPKIDITLINGQTHPIGNWTSAEWFYVGLKCALGWGFPQPIEEYEKYFFIHQENNKDAFYHGMEIGEQYKGEEDGNTDDRFTKT